ncbi:hypothetical protein BDA99DRAFT_575222 [Phascolomyces articulosus]|uniref:Uncharacterized protein n=1 Tax=Phascolomyces articulosus TaxID=60185 RepID=A0AAD5JRX7_9FUNG|nr:hypothetical protein BDA99DRAFT_575222 [Phascolomyces articulosus]
MDNHGVMRTWRTYHFICNILRKPLFFLFLIDTVINYYTVTAEVTHTKFCFCKIDYSEDYKLMVIIFNTNGRIDIAEQNDEFIIQVQQTRNALPKFFSRADRRVYPLCETRCGLDPADRCGYYSIRIPGRSGGSRTCRSILKNEQHKHGVIRRQTYCHFGEFITRFNQFSLYVQKFLWFAHGRGALAYNPRNWRVDEAMYQ